MQQQTKRFYWFNLAVLAGITSLFEQDPPLLVIAIADQGSKSQYTQIEFAYEF